MVHHLHPTEDTTSLCLCLTGAQMPTVGVSWVSRDLSEMHDLIMIIKLIIPVQEHLSNHFILHDKLPAGICVRVSLLF